ncbi:MAG: hypothetical protein KA715_08980 [Xanthomonadaceae bacterium]|nr:hypothetical protein [Xanthomonadaceae bacterium]
MSVYSGIALFIVFFSGASVSTAFAAKISPVTDALQSAQIKLDFETSRAEGILSFYTSPQGTLSMISQSMPAVSKRSVLRKISLLQGKKESLKTRTQGKITFFGFESNKGQIHFFSNKGGYLLLTPGEKTKKTEVSEWLTRLQVDEDRK